MTRQRSQATQKRDQELLALIMPIKTDHPLWGYRRIWAYLKYRQGHVVGINRVHRVMKESNLLAKFKTRARKIVKNAVDGYGHYDSLKERYEEVYGAFRD